MSELSKRALIGLAVLALVVQGFALGQNLGAAPQTNVAVQGQTGAQPEGAFLNFVNWIGNVIAPVGAGVAVLGAVAAFATGRGVFRWLLTAAGLLAVSGLTRQIEFWIAQAARVTGRAGLKKGTEWESRRSSSTAFASCWPSPRRRP